MCVILTSIKMAQEIAKLNPNEDYGINPVANSANRYFEQQCANPTYEEELIKRAIQEVRKTTRRMHRETSLIPFNSFQEAATIMCKGKTEVSLLHELLSKRGKTPNYELLQTEGETHEPTFRYKVTFGKDYGIGSASSKKQAKHQAARDLLRIFGVDVTHFDLPVKEEVGADGVDAAGDDMANPIGRLQEMCTLKRWTPPKYDTHTEEGEPHKKNFVMSCTVMNLTEVGEGSSKKMAKRRAAQKILKLMKSQAEEDIGNRFLGMFSDMKNLTLDKMTPSAEQEQEKFRRNMRALNSPAFQELTRACLHTPEMRTKLKGLLQRISEENGFRLIECPLEERSSTGKYLFMLEMTTVPIGVCTGRGDSLEEAETDAIIGSLDFLKMMTK